MLKIIRQSIQLTRGDDASIQLIPRYKDGTQYTVQEGDRAIFRLKLKNSLVELTCSINTDTNKIVVTFAPSDTINIDPGIYRYEAELITSFGFHYTFIEDKTFIIGKEYEQRLQGSSSQATGSSGNNLPTVDGEITEDPVVYGDLQPTNPSFDYRELSHKPKLNDHMIVGDLTNEDLGIPTKTSDLENDSDFVSDDAYVHTDYNYDATSKALVDALPGALEEISNALDGKVDKVAGKGLSENDYTTAEKNKLSGIAAGAEVNVQSDWNQSESSADDFIKNKPQNLVQDANYVHTDNNYDATAKSIVDGVTSALSGKVDKVEGKGLSTEDYTTAEKNKLAGIAAGAEVNVQSDWNQSESSADDFIKNKPQNLVQDANYVHTDNNYDATAKSIVDGVTSALSGKVDKVEGKGLSTEDYTTAEKNKLAGIAAGAEVNVQSDWNQSDSSADDFVKNKPQNLVQDANYVHTDNNYDATAKSIVDGVTSALSGKVDKVEGKDLSTEDYTTAEKNKLSGIAAGAEVNVQSDWNQSESSADDFIKNKPQNLVQDADYVHTDNNYDATAKSIVDGVTSALSGKVDKVEGKDLSTEDYTTAEKNKLSGIAAGAEVNVQSDWNQSESSADDFIKNKPQNLVQDADYVHTDNNYDATAKGIVDGVTSALASKVDKVEGKGLSTEDYTTAEKNKLAGISANAKKVEASNANGYIKIDGTETKVYDDSGKQDKLPFTFVINSQDNGIDIIYEEA